MDWLKQGRGVCRKRQKENNLKGISRKEFLKAIGAGVVIAGSGSFTWKGAFAVTSDKSKATFIAKAGTNEPQNFPTTENPLIIDEGANRVLIYTEVQGRNIYQWNTHWGVVFKEGRFQDKGILKSFANQTDFYDALIKIGAKPGNNLNKDTIGKYVEGDLLDVKATWSGLGKELSLNEIFIDEKGKGFQIKFGGNRKASEEQKTGCITCLESCWVAISSNASYPQIGSIKRFIKPNSRFKGRAEVLPEDGKPVILIYKVASGN
jgi:hypothetical protein